MIASIFFMGCPVVECRPLSAQTVPDPNCRQPPEIYASGFRSHGARLPVFYAVAFILCNCGTPNRLIFQQNGCAKNPCHKL
jgi:hypothetical protein